jgi:hypothetical protein
MKFVLLVGSVQHLIMFLTIILSPAPLIASDVSGQVISVLDGDTIKVLHNNLFRTQRKSSQAKT